MQAFFTKLTFQTIDISTDAKKSELVGKFQKLVKFREKLRKKEKISLFRFMGLVWLGSCRAAGQVRSGD
jgi:hypothetical protein